MKQLRFFTVLFVLIGISCNKHMPAPATSTQSNSATNALLKTNAISVFTEDFETGTKASYAAGNVTVTTGSWNLNDALLGTSASDVKNGSQSARVRNSGQLTMQFDKATGASTVTILHAKYGSDASSTWQLWYSVNGGSTYQQTGSTITTSSTTLQSASFTLNIAGNIRLDIRKTDGTTNRINFDNITINDYTSATNPVPTLTTISPNSATAGAAAFSLIVTGTNFVSGSLVKWNGATLTTTFTSSTQLTAAVPATNVATAGTASVTVFSPTPGGGTSSAATFTISAAGGTGGKKFLFDNTKAETAGNADWVIDEDNGTPQRIPTPAQSTITASTAETYWTGAISSWGIALVKAGNTVETLPSTGSITYGNSSNPQDLSNYNVFVVDEPNTLFTEAEKTAILTFIKSGGGLFMISDHNISDRNNDGYDSPAIWNDLMTNNSLISNPFGFSIDLTNITEVSSNVLTNSTSNKILNGSQGSVSQLEFNNGATITLSPTANSTVQGLIWQGGYTQSTTHIMSASSTYGTGRIYVVCDSSPMDDGTGASGNSLYVSWTLYSHKNLFMNASLWLAKLQ